MGSPLLERHIRERQRALRLAIGDELRRARVEAGLSARAVSRIAGIHHSHLPRIESGERLPGAEVLVALAAVLGRDVSIRLFEATGPRVRDRVQVLMIEALLRVLHAVWSRRLEVPVHRPVRGVIDVVLQHRETHEVVADEGHSQRRTVELQLRWAAEKADALASARGWPWADMAGAPEISRLLLLRSTAANRDLVASLPATFRAAFPARSADAYRALTAGERWPGAAILWVNVAGARTTVMHGPPRGIDT